MSYTTLIGVGEAATYLDDPDYAFVDCRFVLAEPRKGREEYLSLHIRGAVYADLDRDLSGPIVPGRTGRHPLPSEAAFDAAMSRLGIDDRTQVVAYDESSGTMAAARLWWLLRWAGHDAVAVLDGGFRRWQAAGLPCSSGSEDRAPRRFTGRYRASMPASADEILSSIATGDLLVLDTRGADRYRGENETIDPVAGHIPGAVSMPYHDNLTPDGSFLPPDELKRRFETASRAADPESTVFYCGSGVTAAHNVLAYAHAGLGIPRLYPGSWSEWITDPARPVETGSGEPG